jgi:hypothetical protein
MLRPNTEDDDSHNGLFPHARTKQCRSSYTLSFFQGVMKGRSQWSVACSDSCGYSQDTLEVRHFLGVHLLTIEGKGCADVEGIEDVVLAIKQRNEKVAAGEEAMVSAGFDKGLTCPIALFLPAHLQALLSRHGRKRL